MKKNVVVLVVVIVLALIIGIAASHKRTSMDDSQNTGTGMPEQSSPSPSPAQPAVPSATTSPTTKTFIITGSNFAFAPNTLSVNKGDTVVIVFKNSGGMHDLKIDEFNVATPRIGTGQEATIQFVADKTGSFQYYCSVGSHRAMGMWGTLTVQ